MLFYFSYLAYQRFRMVLKSSIPYIHSSPTWVGYMSEIHLLSKSFANTYKQGRGLNLFPTVWWIYAVPEIIQKICTTSTRLSFCAEFSCRIRSCSCIHAQPVKPRMTIVVPWYSNNRSDWTRTVPFRTLTLVQKHFNSLNWRLQMEYMPTLPPYNTACRKGTS